MEYILPGGCPALLFCIRNVAIIIVHHLVALAFFLNVKKAASLTQEKQEKHISCVASMLIRKSLHYLVMQNTVTAKILYSM